MRCFNKSLTLIILQTTRNLCFGQGSKKKGSISTSSRSNTLECWKSDDVSPSYDSHSIRPADNQHVFTGKSDHFVPVSIMLNASAAVYSFTMKIKYGFIEILCVKRISLQNRTSKRCIDKWQVNVRRKRQMDWNMKRISGSK